MLVQGRLTRHQFFGTEEETGIRGAEFSDDDFFMPTNHEHEEGPSLPNPSDMVVHTF